jgi:pyruvate/2-oxoglutarate dehydrogenase complex dihydrolipoamide acyltransferase (E2) component
MTTRDFHLPDLGEGVHEGPVMRLLFKPFVQAGRSGRMIAA